MVSHATDGIEHPELVAQRIRRFVTLLGAENVIAGTDCGFATFAGSDEIEGGVAWAKLEAVVRGAEIASKRLRNVKRAKPAVVKKKVAAKKAKAPARKAKKGKARRAR